MCDLWLNPDAALLERAYRLGLFPMADPDSGRVDWFQPEYRGVLPLDQFHVRRSLRRVVTAQPFRITSDCAFEAVMRGCAEPRVDDPETWISEGMIAGYVALHASGKAHSIEAWAGERLVGGLYGVHLGSSFFGESMFSRTDEGGTNASKVCLVHLVGWMRHRGFRLLDTQLWNPHLEQFGCVEIAHSDFEVMLEESLASDAAWGEFSASEAMRCGLHWQG